MSDHIRTKTAPPAKQRIPMDKGDAYTCPELGRPPGMSDARFLAFNLPSIVNGKRVEPKRIV